MVQRAAGVLVCWAAGVGVVVPLGGAVLNEQLGKALNVASPSAVAEVGLEVLELGVGIGGVRDLVSINLRVIVKDLVSLEMSYLRRSNEVFK